MVDRSGEEESGENPRRECGLQPCPVGGGAQSDEAAEQQARTDSAEVHLEIPRPRRRSDTQQRETGERQRRQDPAGTNQRCHQDGDDRSQEGTGGRPGIQRVQAVAADHERELPGRGGRQRNSRDEPAQQQAHVRDPECHPLSIA
ncbi:hypothetical protein JOJ86_002278 [Rhodococcus percolatus]|uniref:hypothetical protein n=1 Tax=Rhodococcus opacus TaxID=37919 RepID=UPI0017E6C9FD|nr:hypothetical protein [Rhodococcus opacus]MBA8958987.1 hypothetical protein [Rhodococcus opacus]MBP2204552.1 hypothetical protein [Rhodococcus opacus]